MNDDEFFMREAMAEARLGESLGEVPIGALVVRDGEILARGCNRTIVDRDPTGHAEMVALRAAGIRVGNHRLVGASLFVTVEPCTMCKGAIVQARLARVVYGCPDPKAGAPNHAAEYSGGVLAEDCAFLLREFFQARR